MYRRDDQDDRDDLQQRALSIPVALRGSCLTGASTAGRPARNYSMLLSKPTAYSSAGHKIPTSINTANHFRHLSLMILLYYTGIFVTINFLIFYIKLRGWKYVPINRIIYITNFCFSKTIQLIGTNDNIIIL